MLSKLNEKGDGYFYQIDEDVYTGVFWTRPENPKNHKGHCNGGTQNNTDIYEEAKHMQKISIIQALYKCYPYHSLDIIIILSHILHTSP